MPRKSILWCDNLSAKVVASNPVMHAQSKHIEIDVHYIRDQVLHNQVTIAYVPTTNQIADCLTKPLTHTRFNILRDKLGMIESPQFERELEKVTIIIIRINTKDIMSIILSLILFPCTISHVCSHHYQLLSILFIVFNDDFIIEIMIVLYCVYINTTSTI